MRPKEQTSKRTAVERFVSALEGALPRGLTEAQRVALEDAFLDAVAERVEETQRTERADEW